MLTSLYLLSIIVSGVQGGVFPETIHSPLSQASAYQWTKFQGENEQLGMTAGVHKHENIHPCALDAGDYKIRVAGNKYRYLGINGRRLSLKVSLRGKKHQDVWTVSPQAEHHGVSPVLLKYKKRGGKFDGNIVGAQKEQFMHGSVMPMTSVWTVFPAVIAAQDAQQPLVAWCGANGRKYLQIAGGNQWIQNTEAFLVYKNTVHPRTAFEFVKVHAK